MRKNRKHPLAVLSLEDRLTPAGTISGTVWNDLDGDRTRGASEPGIAGRTVYLDANKNGRLDAGETSTTSGTDGSYRFTGLAAGTYAVAQVLPSGWQQAYPDASHTVRLGKTWQSGGTTVFDFEELRTPTDVDIAAYHKNGFTFDTSANTSYGTKFHVFGYNSGAWWDGSTGLASTWAPSTISLVQDNGQPFAIYSIRLGEYGGYYRGGTVKFTGNKANNGGTVSQTFTMDAQPGFQTFLFNGFDNLQTLTWQFTGFSDYHQFDDVTVSGGTYVVDDASGKDFGSAQVPLPAATVSDVSELEGSAGLRTLAVPVTLAQANPYPVTIYYHTDSGSAVGGTVGPASFTADFVIASGSVTIPVGQTSGEIDLTINGDKTWENDEYFFVRLDGATNATLGNSAARIDLRTDDVTAAADSYSMVQPDQLSVSAPGVLTNDKGIPGQTTAAELTSNPAHGTLTLNPDGSFTYTANAGYYGTDTFTYDAVSGGYRATATVTIQVKTLAPTIQAPSSITFDEDTPYVFSASTQPIVVSDADAGSNPLQMRLSTYYGALFLSRQDGLTIVDGANGTTMVAIRGTLEAINAALDGLTYWPPSDFWGNNSPISLSVDDLTGNSTGKSISVNINPVNDPPVNTMPFNSVVTSEDRGFSIPKPTVSDVDNAYGGINTGVRAWFYVPGGTGTILVGISNNYGLTVTGNGTSTVLIEAPSVSSYNNGLASLSFTPAKDVNGAVPFYMTTSDKGNYGSGGEMYDTDIIAVNITPVNDAPLFSIPNTGVSVVGGTGSKSFSNFATSIQAGPSTATDELATQSVNFVVTSLTTTGGLTFATAPTISSSGTLSFEPTPGTYGAATVKVVLQDDGGTGNGGVDTSTTQTFTVTVTNQAPVVTAPPDQPASEGVAKTFDLGSFTDNGPDQPWTVTVNWGDGSSDQFSESAAGAIDPRAHTYADDGTYTVTLTVADKTGATSDPKTFSVSVAAVKPVIAPPADQSANEGVSNSFALGSLADNAADAPWTVTVDWGDGSADQFTANAAGSLGSLAHTYADNGIYTVTLTAAEWGGLAGDPATFQVSVAAVKPVVSPPADQTANEGAGKSFTLGSFTDNAADGPWTISVNWGDGNSEQFSASASGSLGSLAHTYADDSTYTVTLTATERGGLASDPVTFKVVVAGLKPVIMPPGDQTASEGTSKTFSLGTFTDNTADAPWTVRVKWGDGTSDQFTTSSTGSLGNLAHRYADNGIYPVTLTVTERGGLASDPTTFKIKVANVAPTMSTINGQTTGVRGQERTYVVSATDPGADPLSFSWNVTDGSGNVVRTGSGTSFDFTPLEAGNFTITSKVDDGDGGQDSKSVTLTSKTVEVQSDPVNAGKYMLAVGGTTAADTISVKQGTGNQLTLSGTVAGSFGAPNSQPFSRVLVFAQAGNDVVSVDKKVTVPSWLYGGDGNDTLGGGSGPNVLLGGGGADSITGGAVRDILIGGVGADIIDGGNDDDIEIAGTTSYDDDDSALQAILAEWTSSRTFASRQANLSGTGAGTRLNGNVFLTSSSVFNDGDVDTLISRAGSDWLFYNATDKVR